MRSALRAIESVSLPNAKPPRLHMGKVLGAVVHMFSRPGEDCPNRTLLTRVNSWFRVSSVPMHQPFRERTVPTDQEPQIACEELLV